MNTPEWFKSGIYGAFFGAVFIAFVGFFWGGWMTAGGADKMATKMARDEVVAALVPFCLDMSRADDKRLAKLVTIRAASSFKRGEAVMDAGWATVPGSDEPNRDVAQACIEGLNLDAS